MKSPKFWSQCPACWVWCCWLGFALPNLAATRSWNNPAGGAWSTADNWTPSGVPATGDTVEITLDGTYTVTLSSDINLAALTVGGGTGHRTLSASGGTLQTTSGTIAAQGELILTGGGLVGSFVIQPGGELELAGGNKALYRATLINEGTVSWTGGDLLTGLDPALVITNLGLWTISGDASVRKVYGGAAPQFINLGTVRKTGGTGRSLLGDLRFVSFGAIEVASGILELSSNLGSELGGTVAVAAGATFRSSGGTSYEAGGAFSGEGTKAFTGGTLILQTNILEGLALTGGDILIGPVFQEGGAITNLTLAGSRLTGTNRVGHGVLTVSPGDLTGQLTVEAGGELVLGSGNKAIYGLTLINEGTVQWQGGDLLTGLDPAMVITNLGLWTISGDASVRKVYGGAAPQFVNLGTVRKTGGTGRSLLGDLRFVSFGAIEVESGILELSSNVGSELGGTVEVAAGATFRSSSGTSYEAGGVFTGEGTMVFTGGTLILQTNILEGLVITGGDVLTGPSFQEGGAITNLTVNGGALTGTNRIGQGVVTVQAGSLRGLLTVQAGGTLVLSGPGNNELYRLTLINEGTVSWTGGDLLTGQDPAMAITNLGLWTISGDASVRKVYGGAAPQFINLGTVRKTGGTGRSLLGDLRFVSFGAIEVESGILELSSNLGSELGGTVAVAAGATFRSSSGTSYEAGGVFTGEGTKAFTRGTLVLQTNILEGLSLTGGDLQIGPVFQEGGAITNLTLSGSRLAGTNRVGHGVLTVSPGDLIGQLTVQAGGELVLGGGNKAIYQFTLINEGTVSWTGGDLLTGQDPAVVITNLGLWTISGDASVRKVYGGAAPRFVNLGTVRKTGGTGRSLLGDLTFVNSALIEVAAGTLELPAAFTNNAGTLRLLGGRLQASGGITLNNGRLEGAGEMGALLAGGSAVVSPGTNGPGRIVCLSGLTLTNDATLSLDLLGPAPGSEYDQLAVQGPVRLEGSRLDVDQVGAVVIGTQFIVIDNDGADGVVGLFPGLADGALFTADARLLRAWYARGSGNDVALIRDDGGVLLQHAVLTTNGVIAFEGRGTNSALYTIYAATNLVDAPWELIGTTTADPGGLFQFIDAQPAELPMRFFISFGP